jgi:hypothetical protein
MTMRVAPAVALFASLFVAHSAWAWSWTGYLTVGDHYIHSTSTGSTDRVLVIASTQNFHSCGWNNAGQVHASVVGDQMFNTLTAAFLTAWTTDKQLDLLIDGCDGDRAKVVGIKIAK